MAVILGAIALYFVLCGVFTWWKPILFCVAVWIIIQQLADAQLTPLQAGAAVALFLALCVVGAWWREWRHTPAGQSYQPVIRIACILAVLIVLVLALEPPGSAASRSRAPSGTPLPASDFAKNFFASPNAAVPPAAVGR